MLKMPEMKQTKEQFELEYTERTGITVETWRELGLIAIPCCCAHNDCMGWTMVDQEEYNL